MHLAGIVLAGGESRRMGEPKAWLPFGPPGGTMLTEVVATVREVCAPVYVIAAPEQSLPELPDDVEILRDPVPGQGPLAALVTGLSALPANIEVVFLCSCDVPLLRAEFISGLAEHLWDQAEYVVPRVGELSHPLAAIYRTSVLETARDLVARDVHSVKELFAQQIHGVDVTGEKLRRIDPNGVNLLNLNTREDYQRALELYRQRVV